MLGSQVSDRSCRSPGYLACWLVALLALMALTVGLHEFVPRYEASERQLLKNADFERDLAGWSATGRVRPGPRRSGTAVLKSAGVESSILRQTTELDQGPITAILRAKLAAEIIEPGNGQKGGAWIMVGNLLGSGGAAPHWAKGTLAPYLTTSSHGWRSFEAILDLPPAQTVTFEAGIVGRAGSVLSITELTVLEAFERPAFWIGRLALIIAWGLTAAWGSATVYRSLASGRQRLAFALVLGVAMLGFLMPEMAVPEMEPFLASVLEATGHALLFFFLAFTLRIGRPQDPFWSSLGVLALVAAATEVVQLFVPGRGPELYDWLADLAGILAGLLLFEPAVRLHNRTIGHHRVR